MSYTPPLGDASTIKKGIVQLSGDLGGTAAAPTVPGLATKLDTSLKGAADGVASLDAGGKVPSSQLQLTFPVTSVASRTGDVTLTKTDVGLENVDNTTDASKPISSATQAAIDAKASTSHTHATADVTGLQAALDAKAASSHTHTASQVSDSTAIGRDVLTAADASSAQIALGITNTVQVVDAFGDVTAPVYGTLYVVRA